MRDGPIRRAIKAVARWNTLANLAFTRALLRRRGARPYALGGACRACAKCCEEPAIAAGWFVWRFPTLRAIFLGWHRVVNGFELLRREREGRVFVFRCTHFDPVSRRCDSYDSRPAMCRDYPRALLYQPWPQLFDECGHRPLHPDPGGLQAALARTALSPEAREALEKKLRLR